VQVTCTSCNHIGFLRLTLPWVPHMQDVIASLDDDSGAGQLADLSVHLCFICLLHLANEHGLVVTDSADLRQLTISYSAAA
jgi:Condensin complex subunit 2